MREDELSCPVPATAGCGPRRCVTTANDYMNLSGRDQRMSEDTRWSPSRRTFVKYGAVSTGTLLGTPGASADADSKSDDPTDEAIDQGAMLPYQFTPNSRFTVVEPDLEWRPERLEGSYRTNVISYDHAPSYRALLLTEPDGTIEPNQSFGFRSVRGSFNAANRRYVTVGLE